MVNRQNVNVLNTDEPIDNPVWLPNQLAHRWIGELWHNATGFRKVPNLPCRLSQSGDDNGGVVRRILTDEPADSAEVFPRLAGPEDSSHVRNCFLTSSCGTT